MNDGDFESVAPLDDFLESVPLSLQLSTGQQVCLVRVNGEVFCISEECPHGEFPMSDGAMVEDYIIECPMHGSQYDVRDGSVVDEPGEDPIQTFEVKVLDNRVWVRARE